MSRHYGLDPQSRGEVVGDRHTGFKAVSIGWGTSSVIPAIITVIADLIRNPEGERPAAVIPA